MYFKSQTEVPPITCFCLEFFQDENSPVTYISQYDYSSLYERLAAYINSGLTYISISETILKSAYSYA
jgi:hypothetical protein